MRYRTLLVAAFLVLSVAICGLSAEEELTNDSQKTAVAVRITFMTRVMITGHGREFSNQEPASGLSDVFVFSGGEVRRHRTFEVKWSPSIAIKSVEWLEELSAEDQAAMDAVRTCTRVLSPGDDLQSCIDQANDGMEICLEPGIYSVDTTSYMRISNNIKIRGLGESALDCQITCPEYGEVGFWVQRDGALRFENLSFMIPTYSSGCIDARDTSQCYLQNVEVVAGSIFQLRSLDHASVEVSNCVLFSLAATQQGQMTISETRFDGDFGTGYEYYMAAAMHEAQIALSDCTISHYEYALYAREEGHLMMTNCFVTDIEQDFLACTGFTGSIQGTGNRIDASLGRCSSLLPSGFLSE